MCPHAIRARHHLPVSFANEKGGAGKSTDCVSLAGAYAGRERRRVHIIDADSNLTAIRWSTGLIDDLII